jgi:hypothetical protein
MDLHCNTIAQPLETAVLTLTRLNNIKPFIYKNCQIEIDLRKENFSGLLVEEHLHCSITLRKS